MSIGSVVREGLLLRNATVLTCDPAQPSLLRGDVYIREGRIAAIGPRLEVAHSMTEVDLSGATVFPGLVDAHHHLWESPHRLTHPDLSLSRYFSGFVSDAAKGIEANDLALTTESALLRALRAGITTTFDWCHATNSASHAWAAIEGAVRSGARYVFGYGPPVALGYYGSEKAHPEAMERVAAKASDLNVDRLSVAAALRGPDLSSMQVVRQDIHRARSLGLPISVHVGTALSGPGGIEKLDRAGLLGPDMQFVHLTDSSPAELSLVKDAGARVVIPVLAELAMRTGRPPLRALVSRSQPFGLGIDSTLGAPHEMFSQMRSAWQVLRDAPWDNDSPPEGSRAEEVLTSATLGGAQACWLDGDVGSLTPGKWADLVVMRPARAPSSLAEAFAQVLWEGHHSNIELVFVAGNKVPANIDSQSPPVLQINN